MQTALWTLMYLLRWAWLNIYPLLALAAGVAFVVCVPQVRDILANLRVDPWWGHAVLFFAALGAWSATLWYAMRLLSSTKFPAEAEPHPSARAAAEWIKLEMPRLAPTAALVAIAGASSIFLRDPPSGRWILLLAAGLLPLAWSFAWLGDRAMRRRIEERLPLAHPLALAGCVLFAAAVGLYAWWLAPFSENLFAFEPGLLGAQVAAIAVLLLCAVWLYRGRGDGWMLAASVLWLGAAGAAVAWDDGFGLPGLFVAGAGFGLWFVARRRQLYQLGSHGVIKWLRLERGTVYALAASLAVLAALVVGFSQAPITLGAWLGTLAIVFIALAIWSFVGSLWVLLPKVWGLPSLAVVPILWLALLGGAPDHALRDTGYAKAERPSMPTHFADWQREVKQGPIFFVAAAGGGLRAAYWTASMLAAADDATCGQFGRHVYAYSGVSGGSLGIAAYLAQRQVWAAEATAEQCRSERVAEMQHMLGRDFLAPVAGSLLFAELWQRFAHTPLDNDRGTTLAKAWGAAWDSTFPEQRGRFDEPFLKRFSALEGGAAPAVFLNATTVDSGRRALVANVAQRLTGSHDLFLHGRNVKLKTAGLTVREAVLNSARFTYVSPAGTVKACIREKNSENCRERVWDRVVDGGYFENSGLATLSDVLEALGLDKGGEAPAALKNRVFVVVIDNSGEPELACPAPDSRQRDPEERAEELPPLSGVTAPLEAFLNVREARAGLEVRRLRADFPCRPQPRILDWSLVGEADLKQEREQPPLGWFLSRHSEKLINVRVLQLTAPAGAAVPPKLPFHVAGCAALTGSRGPLGPGLPQGVCP